MKMSLPSFKLCTSLLLFYSLISFLSQTRTEAVASYNYHFCPNTTTFTANSTFKSNLNHLFAYFNSNATRNIEFYNATASSIGNSVDTVYGFFVCRGDRPADVCQSCVASATEDIVKRCPPSYKVVAAWYDECILRYSNQSFFSNMSTEPPAFIPNLKDIEGISSFEFNLLLEKTMNYSASEISKVGIGAKKFGTKEVNFTASQTLYILVQCTPDLSGNDCNTCLQKAIPFCCHGKQGVRVLYPSCIARFELYPFYLKGNTSALTLGPPPPSPGTETTSKGKVQLLFSCCSFQMIGKLGTIVDVEAMTNNGLSFSFFLFLFLYNLFIKNIYR